MNILAAQRAEYMDKQFVKKITIAQLVKAFM